VIVPTRFAREKIERHDDNDEIRMTNDEISPNDEARNSAARAVQSIRNSRFIIRSSFVIRALLFAL
jgi:hypothetical protein